MFASGVDLLRRISQQLTHRGAAPLTEPQIGDSSIAAAEEHVRAALRFAVPNINEQFRLELWAKHLEEIYQKSIRIFYVPLPTGIFGFRFVYQDSHSQPSALPVEVIAVNSNLSALIRTTTLAHELAHTAFRDPTLQVDEGGFGRLLRGQLNMRAAGNDQEEERTKRFQDFRAEYLARRVLTQMWVAQRRLSHVSTDQDLSAVLEKLVD